MLDDKTLWKMYESLYARNKFVDDPEWTTLRCLELIEELIDLRKEKAELNSLFELQRTRMAEATKVWRAATGSPDNLFPDLGKLLDWLLLELDRQERRAEKAEALNQPLLERVEELKKSRKDLAGCLRLYQEAVDNSGCPQDESQYAWLKEKLEENARMKEVYEAALDWVRKRNKISAEVHLGDTLTWASTVIDLEEPLRTIASKHAYPKENS